MSLIHKQEMTEEKLAAHRANGQKSLFKVRKVELTRENARNGDRPGYVHEKTGGNDKMSSYKHGFLQEYAAVER
jgi:hypothetical protein